MKTKILVLLSIVLGACAATPKKAAAPTTSPADVTVPTLRLPRDVLPTAESVVLKIDPKQERFQGVVDIDITLERARSVLWLHGKDLHVTRATANDVPGDWLERDPSGLASLTLSKAIPAGKAKLHIEYDAPFGPKLEGLHKIVQRGESYAFTQFEAIAARLAFPCFDEPDMKIPWDETLIVPAALRAIANTHEIDRKVEGGLAKVRFATTPPMPSYLVAFAVGPLDIVVAPEIPANAVRKRSLPLRAITAAGRGADAAYALAHAGEILAVLEQYFGIEYPYDKLDLIAVPDKGGAMENPGAVTFDDWLLLFDEKTAPLAQKRAYARVVAHELAHMWVGDLVTTAWWDDIWLNEAFATWAGTKAADAWDPKTDAAIALMDGIQGAIGADSLVSARQIRQPIVSTNDIENAFDAITYRKGGGVVTMFERWMGPEVFQRGMHEHLVKHRFGNATADNFLDAESAAAKRDVKTPFRTFLDQPGVPFVEAEVRCDGNPRLHLKQSRYLPLGSTGDTNKRWQIPICARYGIGGASKEACTLLIEAEADLPLGATCPDWVFPNSGASGYFRHSQAEADLIKLRTKGYAQLTTSERIAYGNSLRAAFSRGTLPIKAAIEAAAPLANDSHRSVADEAMGFIDISREWLYAEPLRAHVEAYARKLFHAQYQKLGWAAKDEDGTRVQLRTGVLNFLAFTARDPIVLAEAKKRGLAFVGYKKDGAIHKDAVDPNLAEVALEAAGENADRPLWDAVRALLGKTDDAELRAHLIHMLVSAKSPALLPVVRELVFDPSLRATEVTAPLWSQLRDPALRDAAWQWEKDNFDRLLAAVPKHHGQTQLISMASVFCDETHAKEVEAFFTPARVAQIDGGPRVLATVIEGLHLCAVKRAKQEASLREMFKK